MIKKTFLSISDANKGLTNLTLSVYPEVIRRGHSAQLYCNYETNDIQIYSIKWYRGTFEFYRYTPFEHPPGKSFYMNTKIKVDVSRANYKKFTLDLLYLELECKSSEYTSIM